jgi:hypothetical protein
MGTLYDLFVKEMREKERRERQFTWYAPEREPVEYYVPRIAVGGGSR